MALSRRKYTIDFDDVSIQVLITMSMHVQNISTSGQGFHQKTARILEHDYFEHEYVVLHPHLKKMESLCKALSGDLPSQ